MKICIDAGHYGKYNRSPVVKEYYESDMNWKLHLLLKAALEGYGIEVVTTRKTQGENLAVTPRGRLAKGCDLFLSLHSNACATPSVDRAVAIYQVEDETSDIDEKSRAVAELLAGIVGQVMETPQAAKTYSRLASSDLDGDGKKDDNYYGVLHGARSVGVPGVILEHSYHTNERATRWLMEEANLQKLAQAEADAIAGYFGVEKPAEKLYRVQIGAFRVKENAQRTLEKAKAAGFDAFITEVRA